MTISKKQIISFLLVFLIPFYLVRFKLGVPTTLIEIFVILIFLTVLTLRFNNIVNVIKSINIFILIGAISMIVGGVIGAFISPDHIGSLGELKGFVLVPIIAGITILSLGPNNKKYIKLGFYLSTVIISLEAIVERLLNMQTYDDRIIGIYRLDANASPNYLALFATPIAVMLLHEIFNKKVKSSWQSLRIISFLLIATAISMTRSRAAAAVLILFIFYELYCYLYKGFNKKVVNIFSLIIILFIILFSAKVALPNLAASANSGRVSSSNNIRYEIWTTTVREILPKHWIFGVGMGNFQATFKDVTSHRVNFDEYISPLAVTPHNVFLSTWLNLGLIGLVGFIMVLYGCIITQRNNNVWLLALVSVILLGLFDTTVYKNDLGFFFWIIVLVGSNYINKKELGTL